MEPTTHDLHLGRPPRGLGRLVAVAIALLAAHAVVYLLGSILPPVLAPATLFALRALELVLCFLLVRRASAARRSSSSWGCSTPWGSEWRW